MLEKQIFNEFQEFSKRRLNNKYNTKNEKNWEEFLFSSCGDEFFRDIEQLKEEINISDPDRYKNYKTINSIETSGAGLKENHKPIIVYNTNYYKNTLEIYLDRIKEDEEGEQNIIHFGACRITNIPFIFSKIEVKESFSTHRDFHAMYYNDQMLEHEINYIWILFKWVRTSKKVKDY